jgi:hypothetical protein
VSPSACAKKGEPSVITTSRRRCGSTERLPEASTIGKPRPLLPMIGVVVCCAGGSDWLSLGAKLRVSAAAEPGAAASIAFPPVMLVATSAMKRGVGM